MLRLFLSCDYIIMVEGNPYAHRNLIVTTQNINMAIMVLIML